MITLAVVHCQTPPAGQIIDSMDHTRNTINKKGGIGREVMQAGRASELQDDEVD